MARRALACLLAAQTGLSAEVVAEAAYACTLHFPRPAPLPVEILELATRVQRGLGLSSDAGLAEVFEGECFVLGALAPHAGEVRAGVGARRRPCQGFATCHARLQSASRVSGISAEYGEPSMAPHGISA